MKNDVFHPPVKPAKDTNMYGMRCFLPDMLLLLLSSCFGMLADMLLLLLSSCFGMLGARARARTGGWLVGWLAW